MRPSKLVEGQFLLHTHDCSAQLPVSSRATQDVISNSDLLYQKPRWFQQETGFPPLPPQFQRAADMTLKYSVTLLWSQQQWSRFPQDESCCHGAHTRLAVRRQAWAPCLRQEGHNRGGSHCLSQRYQFLENRMWKSGNHWLALKYYLMWEAGLCENQCFSLFKNSVEFSPYTPNR